MSTRNLAFQPGVATFLGAQSPLLPYLSVASNSTLQTGGGTWLLSSWIYYTPGTIAVFPGKTLAEYACYSSSGGVLGAYINGVNQTTFGPTLSAGWNHVVYYFDGTNVGIIKNGGAASTRAASAVTDGAASFRIGFDGSSYLTGQQRAVVWCKAPTSSPATIAAALYNSGVGLQPSQITASQRAAWGGYQWLARLQFNERRDREQ